ncbi:MAG: hypothetical protein JWN43_762, partial [Gammaproteobacteria bacterium]|nr:hypothetical protein [Gammaproteobacteria bacterium]
MHEAQLAGRQQRIHGLFHAGACDEVSE